MESVIKITVIIGLIFVVLFGITALQEVFTVNNIKDDIAELEEISGFTMKRYEGLTEVDNDTSDMDVEPTMIYKEYGDTIIIQQGNSLNVVYEGKTYVVNVSQRFYYEVEGLTNTINYDITEVFPKVDPEESSWNIANALEIENTTFKDERCYALIYESGDDKYTNYVRKDDGVCIGKCEEVNGTTTYEYYVVETEELKAEDFTFDAIFGNYDKVITSAFERPYVERDNGMKEYIDM